VVDFSKKNTKESGGKFADKDWTFTECKWDEVTNPSGTFTGIYFVSQLEGPEGAQEKRWLLGDADKLRNKLRVTDEGTLEDVDDDNPYVPRTNDETSQLFNSLEECGVSMKVLSKIGENPGGLNGTTVHMIEKPTGRKQKKNGVETQYDQTWLVAESLVESSGGGGAKKTAAGKAGSASKSTAAATGAEGKPAPVQEPEDEDEDDATDDVDPIEAAAVAAIQNVLAGPKKFVPTYNAKQNGGGVSLAQMRTAAMGNAVPKELRDIGEAPHISSKPNVSKLLGKPDVYVKYDGELWSFDADEGIVSAIEAEE
jgi:hypothetical protein